jgi:hypothetical protein
MAFGFGIRFWVGSVFRELARLWYFGAHLVTNFGSLGVFDMHNTCANRVGTRNWAPDLRSAKDAELHPGRRPLVAGCASYKLIL